MTTYMRESKTDPQRGQKQKSGTEVPSKSWGDTRTRAMAKQCGDQDFATEHSWRNTVLDHIPKLWFQRDKSPSCWRSMAASNRNDQSRKFKVSILSTVTSVWSPISSSWSLKGPPTSFSQGFQGEIIVLETVNTLEVRGILERNLALCFLFRNPHASFYKLKTWHNTFNCNFFLGLCKVQSEPISEHFILMTEMCIQFL